MKNKICLLAVSIFIFVAFGAGCCFVAEEDDKPHKPATQANVTFNVDLPQQENLFDKGFDDKNYSAIAKLYNIKDPTNSVEKKVVVEQGNFVLDLNVDPGEYVVELKPETNNNTEKEVVFLTQVKIDKDAVVAIKKQLINEDTTVAVKLSQQSPLTYNEAMNPQNEPLRTALKKDLFVSDESQPDNLAPTAPILAQAPTKNEYNALTQTDLAEPEKKLPSQDEQNKEEETLATPEPQLVEPATEIEEPEVELKKSNIWKLPYKITGKVIAALYIYIQNVPSDFDTSLHLASNNGTRLWQLKKSTSHTRASSTAMVLQVPAKDVGGLANAFVKFDEFNTLEFTQPIPESARVFVYENPATKIVEATRDEP